MRFVSKFCNARCIFSKTGAFAHRCFAHESFYTQTIYTQTIYTQTLLYNKLLYTHKLLNAKTFKHKCFLPRLVTRSNAEGVPPTDGNVPRTGIQQKDLVKRHRSPKP